MSDRDLRKVFGVRQVPVEHDVWGPPTMGMRKDAAMAGILGQLGALDDVVQRGARGAYEQASTAFGDRLGGVPRDVLHATGHLVHGDRSVFNDDFSGQSQMYASRALQAGGLTAAGAGLVNLTHAFQNQFGGPADQQEPGSLLM